MSANTDCSAVTQYERCSCHRSKQSDGSKRRCRPRVMTGTKADDNPSRTTTKSMRASQMTHTQ